MRSLKAIDLFAGIGGIRLGFENAFGNDIETVFVSEWDEPAQKTYLANFKNPDSIAGDITKIDEKDVPEFDICLAGFPCQAFSIAGEKKGFNDDYKGICRGTLFLDVARICDYHKPKVIFCENVKGLVIHDKGRTLKVIIKTFEDLGYRVFHKVLNSKDFGVPQNRERIYIVAFRNDIAPESFDFPKPLDTRVTIRDIMEKEAPEAKYWLSTQYLKTLKAHKARHEAKGNGFGYEIRDLDGVAGAIVCGGMGRERNLIIDDRLTNYTPTTNIKGEINREGIRKMTPREWARLQGFPDSFVFPLADTHSYKQLGNSVSVPVIQAIAEKVKEILIKKEREKTEMLTGNKGEWSEIYTLLRLLSEGKLYAADENTKRIEYMYYPILKIIRDEIVNGKSNHTEYINLDIEGDYNNEAVKGNITGAGGIKIAFNDGPFTIIKKEEFEKEADYLFEKLTGGAGQRTFGIERTEGFMSKIGCYTLKAPSSDKTDITMQIHDIQTGYEPICGFSIKSNVGSAPTLLNAGKATNIVYRIEGLNTENAEKVNIINTGSKINDRMKLIPELGGTLHYAKYDSDIFVENLMIVDTFMPDIVAYLLQYSVERGINGITELVTILEDENPLNIKRRGFYRYKVKKLLTAIALGMTPGKAWDGKEDANGGYIIVTTDGDVLAYHIYNREHFEEYLLRNTKLDRPSTSRYDYAYIYEENGKHYIKQNLQIRFM